MKQGVNEESGSQSQVVIHYHYHYYPENGANCEEYVRGDGIQRIRSDQKIKAKLSNCEKTDTESNSSQRSWKKFLKPQFQATATTAARSSDYLPNYKTKEGFRKAQSKKENRGSISEFLLQTPKIYEKKEVSHSSILPNNQSILYRQSFSNHTFGKTERSTVANPDLSPEGRKNRFMKKRQIQTLNAGQLMQLTERQSISVKSQEYKDYKYSLLEEECSYLRQRFLEHYVRNHPEQSYKK